MRRPFIVTIAARVLKISKGFGLVIDDGRDGHEGRVSHQTIEQANREVGERSIGRASQIIRDVLRHDNYFRGELQKRDEWNRAKQNVDYTACGRHFFAPFDNQKPQTETERDESGDGADEAKCVYRWHARLLGRAKDETRTSLEWIQTYAASSQKHTSILLKNVWFIHFLSSATVVIAVLR